MFDAMIALVEGFLQNLRIADFFDVMLVSAFLYTFITWLRRSASRWAITGVSVFVAIYLLARFFEMYLTEMLIQALLILSVISAIVVFQPDIRRLVDRLGTWSLSRRPNRFSLPSPAINILTEAAFKMAGARTGALMAIRGVESWDFQIEGGTQLEGMVSPALLYSIFDTSTPGHDGAVLIEGGRVMKFAAHLPLSTNLNHLDERGTRHAAALGLSERCDALVIVVSEERGRVSVAQAGRLAEMFAPDELESRLAQFWRRHGARWTPSQITWLRGRALQTALLSVSLSVLFWLMLAYRSETVYRTFVSPIEFRNLEANSGLEDPVPVEARVTLTGPERAFRLLDPASLIISLDLARLNDGINKLTVAQDNLKLPSGLSLHHVEPPALQVKVRKLRPQTMSVKVQTAGALPDSLELVEMTASPNRVILLASDKASRRPDSVSTEPIDLRQIARSSIVKSRLVLPPDVRLHPNQTPEITVRVDVRSKREKR